MTLKTPSCSVYAYGIFAPSTLYKLKDSYPEANAYAEIEGVYPSSGGEAANGAFALARLGVSVLLDGNWLADTAEARDLIQRFENAGVDCSRITLKKDYDGIRELIISDQTTRTIFGSYVKLLFTGRQWNEPCEKDIACSTLAMIDPFLHRESEMAAELCLKHQVPFVSVDAHYDNIQAREAAVLILSEEFMLREKEFKNLTPEQIYQRYSEKCRGLLVLTFGSRDVWYGRPGEAVQHFTPYKVDVVDTCGAGDTFRSGIIYALLKNRSDDDLIRYGCALAGKICETFPGVVNSPDEEEFERFFSRMNSERERESSRFPTC